MGGLFTCVITLGHTMISSTTTITNSTVSDTIYVCETVWVDDEKDYFSQENYFTSQHHMDKWIDYINTHPTYVSRKYDSGLPNEVELVEILFVQVENTYTI
tara:strand:+ start:167 stop:469 length:303 start_codon:yes stop_codon:yes gene_type:complete